MKFHEVSGSNVQFGRKHTLAKRNDASRIRDNGLIFSGQRLQDNVRFDVEIKEMVQPGDWMSSIAVGVTTINPEELTDVPNNILRLNSCWCLVDDKFFVNGKPLSKPRDYARVNLDSLEKGNHLGISRTASGDIHIYANGRDLGIAFAGVPDNCFAVFDLRGICGKICKECSLCNIGGIIGLTIVVVAVAVILPLLVIESSSKNIGVVVVVALLIWTVGTILLRVVWVRLCKARRHYTMPPVRFTGNLLELEDMTGQPGSSSNPHQAVSTVATSSGVTKPVATIQQGTSQRNIGVREDVIVDIHANVAPDETPDCQDHNASSTSDAVLDTPTVVMSASSVAVRTWNNTYVDSEAVCGLDDVGEVAAGVGSFKIKQLPTSATEKVHGSPSSLPKLMPVPATALQRSPGRSKSVILEYVSNRSEVNEILVFGSFNCWQHGVRLYESQVGDGLFSGQLSLPLGQHEVKFLVDGEWALSESLPKVQTLEGHFENNLLNVV